MAVLIEGISVVVRCDSIISKHAGGVASFSAGVPSGSMRADGELAAVTFLNPAEAESYVRILEVSGLRHKNERGAVVVDQREGFCHTCGWADFGHTEWNAENGKVIAVCALNADAPQPVVVPQGWTFETSLSASHTYFDPDGVGHHS